MVVSSAGLRTKNDCTGGGQQQIPDKWDKLVESVVMRWQSAGNDVSARAEESALFGAVTYQRLVKTN
jgi:hypothetical protein